MRSAIGNPQPALVIAGPTAVGKSEIATELAERIDAEIINADAFQLYAGLDLLTAKPDARARKRVRHHLVGEFALSESMSVARYLEFARAVVADIRSRRKAIVIVGGTGLYVRALIHGLSPGPAGNNEARQEINALTDREAIEFLQREDPAAYERVDRRNPRRVQRALESARLRGRSAPTEMMPGILATPAGAKVGVVLQRDRAELHHRIARRTAEMFQLGVLAEVSALDPARVGPTAAQMIGWRECLACARGDISEDEARARIESATRQYAKRQTTWFKRETALQPMLLMPDDSAAEVARRIPEREFFATTS